MVIVNAIWFLGGIITGLAINWIIKWNALRSEQKKTGEEVFRSDYVITILVSSILIASFALLARYYAVSNNLDPFVIELASSIFGLAAASAIGQVVFELALRRQLLDQTSKTLAELLLLKKDMIQDFFTPDSRNRIIQLCLQVQSQNEALGSALYQAVQPYFSIGNRRPVRRDFEDDICFFNPDGHLAPDDVLQNYYIVEETLNFRTLLPENGILRVGCASNKESLYRMFQDSQSIYRWLILSEPEEFRTLMNRSLFDVELEIEGKIYNKTSSNLTDKEYEIVFHIPFQEINTPDNVRFRLNVKTLHPKSSRFLSVHLAYPVDEAEISFTYGFIGIKEVVPIDFFVQKEPRIDPGKGRIKGLNRYCVNKLCYEGMVSSRRTIDNQREEPEHAGRADHAGWNPPRRPGCRRLSPSAGLSGARGGDDGRPLGDALDHLAVSHFALP